MGVGSSASEGVRSLRSWRSYSPGLALSVGGDTLCLEEPGLGCLGCQAETQVWMPALLLLASWVITEESLTLSRLQFPCL